MAPDIPDDVAFCQAITNLQKYVLKPDQGVIHKPFGHGSIVELGLNRS